MSDVKFKEGTQEEYAQITPDEHSFYKIEVGNDNDVYLGAVKLSNEADLQAILAQLEDLQNRVYDLENPFYLFAGYTVSQVLDIIDAGEAENYWSVGDVTEPITLDGTVGICEFNNESYKAMIIGFDHNIGLETGYCHNLALQFGQNEDGVNIAFIDSSYNLSAIGTNAFNMNTSNTNSGGWESSQMRTVICPQFLEVLPSSLQNVIGTTTKYTDNIGNNTGSVESNVTATEDKIFLPSYCEIFSGTACPNTYEADYQERYAWYTENNSSTMRIRYRHSTPSSTSGWWLRSPYRNGSADFCNVSTDGSSNTANANTSGGFAPAFNLIGKTLTLVLKPLSECSAAEVQFIVQSGQAANVWSVGDLTESIELNGTVSTYTFENESYHAMLIGLDHNMDLETGGKHNAAFQFGQNDDGVNICFRDPNYDGGYSSTKTGFRMNDSNTNSGGWESCWMRNQIMGEFLEALPSDWQEVIGTTTKYTDNVGGTSNVESNISATEDKIFLPAGEEVFNGSYANSYESNYTERYAWYTENDSSSMRIRYKHFNPSSTSTWWLRSPSRNGSTYFCLVSANGSSGNTYAYYSYGFAPAYTVF